MYFERRRYWGFARVQSLFYFLTINLERVMIEFVSVCKTCCVAIVQCLFFFGIRLNFYLVFENIQPSSDYNTKIAEYF